MESNRPITSHPSDQQAVVLKTLPKPKYKKSFLIPGGKDMFSKEAKGSILDQETLTSAIYNWLRYDRYFKEFALTFAKDPSQFVTAKELFFEFDRTSDENLMPWDLHPDRGFYLAGLISAAIYKYKNIVNIVADKTGVYVYTDQSAKFGPSMRDDWQPSCNFTTNPKAVGQYKVHA